MELLFEPKIYQSESGEKKFKQSLKKVKPARFVWHVTSLRLLKDLSIAEAGIVRGMYGMVFANSFLTDFRDMYPYCIDRMWDFDDIPLHERSSCFNIYSYWRIDTKAFNGQWYIDPNMEYDYECTYNGMPRNYICTDSDIPVSALKNFTFSRQNFENREPIVCMADGAGSYFSLVNDFDTLVPNEAVNRYMRKYNEFKKVG